MRASTTLLRDCANAIARLSGADAVALCLRDANSVSPLYRKGDASHVFPELDEADSSLFPLLPDRQDWQPEVKEGREAGTLYLAVPRPNQARSATRAQGGRRRVEGAGDQPPLTCWIGLHFAGDSGEASSRAAGLCSDASGDAWRGVLEITRSACAQARIVAELLEDPLTGLPGRPALRAEMRRTLEQTAGRRRPSALVLLNPDYFELVNARFGRLSGDETMRCFAERIMKHVRASDFVARYGGASFALLLRGVDGEDAERVGEKVRRTLQEATYLEGRLELGVSAGLAVVEPGELPAGDPASEWLRRADRALCLAKSRGGRRLERWRRDESVPPEAEAGELRSLLTGDLDCDYRNMSLLWQIVRLDDPTLGVQTIAEQIASTLHERLDTQATAIIELESGAPPRVIAALRRGFNEEKLFRIDAARKALLLEARDTQSPVTKIDEGANETRCAVPFPPRSGFEGLIYFESPKGSTTRGTPDATLLEALAAQVASTFERARRVEDDRSRDAHDKKKLERELDEMRNAMTSSDLLYESAAMAQLIESARRVARTPATVLITGESGVGKEVLARKLHQLSDRASAPLVTVDCGAMSSSLIESELFGHDKGAFTGADNDRKGRLEEADGGTLFLDEIGDLPLESQTKLLRFVQERHFSPLGSTRTVTVDTRILAATNVDLAERVQEQRFREDLYHRLHVVQLRVPALRERPEDAEHLARAFVRRFAELFDKPTLRLEEEAVDAIRTYPWPGNVRELHNCLMRAALFAPDAMIGAPDLQLPRTSRAARPRLERALGEAAMPADPLIDKLGHELALLVREHLASPESCPPIAKWLSCDLVLAANAASGGVSRQAARLLGVAPTTYRRRLARAQKDHEGPDGGRCEGWPRVAGVIEELVRQSPDSAGALEERINELILGLVSEECVGRESVASELLGVTLGTYLRKLHSAKGADTVLA